MTALISLREDLHISTYYSSEKLGTKALDKNEKKIELIIPKKGLLKWFEFI